MSLRKFRFDDLSGAEPGSVIRLERAEENHLFKVIRARRGDVIGLMDGRGFTGEAEVGADNVLTLLEKRLVPPPEQQVFLYMAPPRRQQTDQILRQAVELGVAGIFPVICEFSVSEPDASSVAGRWKDVMFEACKQSGNPRLPEMAPPMKFEEAVKHAESNGCTLCYGAVESAGNIHENLAASRKKAWFIGPEGGFSAHELEILKQHALGLHIGQFILRVETAATAGIVILTGANF